MSAIKLKLWAWWKGFANSNINTRLAPFPLLYRGCCHSWLIVLYCDFCLVCRLSHFYTFDVTRHWVFHESFLCTLHIIMKVKFNYGDNKIYILNHWFKLLGKITCPSILLRRRTSDEKFRSFHRSTAIYLKLQIYFWRMAKSC